MASVTYCDLTHGLHLLSQLLLCQVQSCLVQPIGAPLPGIIGQNPARSALDQFSQQAQHFIRHSVLVHIRCPVNIQQSCKGKV